MMIQILYDINVVCSDIRVCAWETSLLYHYCVLHCYIMKMSTSLPEQTQIINSEYKHPFICKTRLELNKKKNKTITVGYDTLKYINKNIHSSQNQASLKK